MYTFELNFTELEGWEAFGDIRKKQLLDIVLDFGDPSTASLILRIFLRNEKQIFFDINERKAYFDNFFYRNDIQNYNFFGAVASLNLCSSELYIYFDILQKKGIYQYHLLLEYFRIANSIEKQIVAKKILLEENDLPKKN